jgi:hypothetical protein
MKTLLLVSCVIFISISEELHSQPIQRWQKVYDGAGWWDIPIDMCKDKSANYIVAGTSVVSMVNFSDHQIVYLSYDPLGNQNWIRTKNNVNSVVDEPKKIFVDDSSYFYCIGIYGNAEYIAKYDNQGNEIWFKFGNGLDDLFVDDIGNVFTAYSASNHAFVRKYDRDGNVAWTRQFDSSSTILSKSVSLTSIDGLGYFLLGNKVVNDTNSNFYIMSFDSSGNRIWYQEFDTKFKRKEWAFKFIKDLQNNLIVIGQAEIPGNYRDIYIVKINSNGELIWTQTINGQANYDDYPHDVIVDFENCIVVTGKVYKNTIPNYRTNQFITAKFSEDGELIFKNIYFDNISLRGTGKLLQIDSLNNVYVAGRISVDSINYDDKMLIIKYDKFGNQIWEIQKDVYSGENDPVKMIINREDDLTITSFCAGQVTPGNIVTFRYSDQPLSIEFTELPTNYLLNQNFPNPFNPTTTISYSIPSITKVNLKVFDVLGNEITTLVDEVQKSGKYQVEFDGTNLSSGIYLYRLITNNYLQTRKMILIK